MSKIVPRILCTIFCFLLLSSSAYPSGKLPDIDAKTVTRKANEIMRAHATYKELSPELVRRILKSYLEELDPAKTYFVKTDINRWLEPEDSLLQAVQTDYYRNKFPEFQAIDKVMVNAIRRRTGIEKQVSQSELPKDVDAKEFKDLEWAESRRELYDRLARLKSIQIEASEKLTDDKREIALKRIEKRQRKYEADFLNSNKDEKQRLILSNILKATASALDSHTAYLTPGEATQFMISVQQRLFGIGAQLRDDLNGFTLVKIIEGGPAHESKKLKAKDRIIAVDGEPVVGMDIMEVVELIRGEKGTNVDLTLVRPAVAKEEKAEETLEVTITRGEVVLQESRIESDHQPYGDGIIGYVKLHSFYQDPDSSSADDVRMEIEKLKEEHNLKGMILDLRYNSGGMLSQAVAVTGLFITKGVVVSIKDSTGETQHLRDIDSKQAWDGPLIVLTNRSSASASEIVAQTLQDYGRGIIVGDDATFGKGSFQTFTLNAAHQNDVNPEGEYKVTRGRYYTVSGKSPQLTGVISDVIVPGALSESEIGEQHATYPLENDSITPNFHDTLSDVPPGQRERIAQLYSFNLQKKLTTYTSYLATLRKNSETRVEHDKNYQAFLKELKKEEHEEDDMEKFGQNDLQLDEAYNITKDLILLIKTSPISDLAAQ